MDYATLEKSNHFKQHHPTPHTQSTRHLDAWSLKIKNVHSSQHSTQPVILRGAEGEVAESAPATSPPKISSAGVASSD